MENLTERKEQRVVGQLVCQPYMLTIAKYNFSVYEMRILKAILKRLQARIKSGIRVVSEDIFNHNSGTQNMEIISSGNNLFGGQVFNFNPSDILGKNSKNHAQIKKALEQLIKKEINFKSIMIKGRGVCNYYDKFITKAIYEQKTGNIEIVVPNVLISILKNLTHGYTKFLYSMAFKTSSAKTIRLYDYLSHFRDIGFVDVIIEKIRPLLSIEEKYVQSNSIYSQVLVPSLSEINSKSDLYCEIVSRIKEGRKIIGWKIRVKKNTESHDKNTMSCLKEIKFYLRHKFLLDEGHLEILSDILNCEKIRLSVVEKIRFLGDYITKNKPKNIQAYIVKTLLYEFSSKVLEKKEK